MQLSSIEINTTYYIISKQMGNNFFTVSIDDINETAVITIPDGNYNPTSLIGYLNNYVTAGPLANTNFSKLAFILDVDPSGSGSGKMIVSTNVPSMTFTLNFQANASGQPDTSTPLPLKFGWIVGYRLGIYTGNSNYVSEGVVDLNGLQYFYLVVDDYNNNVNNSFYSAFNSSILNKNILARISFPGGKFISLSENNLSLITFSRQYFGPVDIQKLNIQLLDEYGRVIDFNNMDYSFCITMQSVYDL
jgi:hypothetical protein